MFVIFTIHANKFKKNMEKILKAAIKKWGKRVQLEMAQEEATELALACRKFIRVQNEKNFNNIAEEIADVEIMIYQIKLMFPELKSISDAVKIDKIKT